MTMLGAINLGLDQALAKDGKVLLLGEDIADPAGGIIGVTKGLSTKYGADRVRDTPISEAAILGAAVGAALAGYRPVAEIMFVDLMPIAIDQLLNHAAKMRFMTAGRLTQPLTVRTATLGGMGMGNGATHNQTLEAWFMHIPGLKVVMPSNAADAKGLLTTAIFDDDPVLFIETGALYGARSSVPLGEVAIPFGQANVVRPGEDVTIISYGLGLTQAVAAAEALVAEGISAEVIDLRTLLPVDFPTVLESVAKTRRAVVVHYATRFAGPGAEIAAAIQEELFGQLAAPVVRIGARFTPVPQAPTIEAAAYPNVSDVTDAVRRVMKGVREVVS
ncbi:MULTISPECIES: alpha-ketoacid dehydrogenase subunit beta [unclassified Pseudofrankia]|uniref:alpha-ketoacid dehydrogenase subunit beta n=1 Tax=unclassified Pseudofrankia TaxID=2994372 RepID=UPI0009F20C93|nr:MULTISPECIES: transketolase C-terminal domain-containing protein [unclassified Pseudofrankia]MDT3442250.1 transketolase C-terminal domain-containing protein [Pseudofrankia sp. BMG5.37]